MACHAKRTGLGHTALSAAAETNVAERRAVRGDVLRLHVAAEEVVIQAVAIDEKSCTWKTLCCHERRGTPA